MLSGNGLRRRLKTSKKTSRRLNGLLLLRPRPQSSSQSSKQTSNGRDSDGLDLRRRLQHPYNKFLPIKFQCVLTLLRKKQDVWSV